jgi:HEAT repeat protein
MRIAFRLIAVTVLAICCIAGCGGVPKVDYSIKKLTASLKDGDPKMRYWAAESLGQYGAEAKSAVPDLVDALQDEDKMVRMGAAYALAEIGPTAAEARGALTAATKDPEKEVRDAATYALRCIDAKTPAKTPSPQSGS